MPASRTGPDVSLAGGQVPGVPAELTDCQCSALVCLPTWQQVFLPRCQVTPTINGLWGGSAEQSV